MSDEARSGLLEDVVDHGMLKEATNENLIEATRLGDIRKRDLAVVGDIFRYVVVVDEAEAENVGKLR